MNLRERAGKGCAKKSVRKVYSAVALSRSARAKEWKGVSRKVGAEAGVVRWEGRAVVRVGERMARRRVKGAAEAGGWAGRVEDVAGLFWWRREGSVPRASDLSR